MIDFAALLLLALVLAVPLAVAARAVWAYRPSRGLRVALVCACVLLALLAAGLISWRFSNARTLQLFGEIVPRVETAAPVVALTFDDGPLPGATERVLQMLEAHQARATFFLSGEAIEEHLSEAERIVGAGHEVGNHSYTHPMLLGLSLDRIQSEIEQTDAQIRRAGYKGEIHFRSPYGKKYVALPYYLARTQRKNIFWDVEPESYREVAKDADRITAHVMENVRPGSIILLHVMTRRRAESLEAVPQIIQALRQRGYRLVTVSELLESAPDQSAVAGD